MSFNKQDFAITMIWSAMLIAASFSFGTYWKQHSTHSKLDAIYKECLGVEYDPND